MKKKRTLILTLTVVMLMLFATTAFAVDPEVAKANAEKIGLWTLLPPLIAIILAFITKNVVLSLFIGVFSGTFLLELTGHNVFYAIFYGFLNIVNQVLGYLSDPWNAGIIIQCMTIGGLIALINKMGGAKAVA